MKIINVVSSLVYGGAETQVINLSKELVRQGHNVKIVSLSNYNPRSFELVDVGVGFESLNKKLKLDFSSIIQLRRIVKEFQPDIVHGYLYDAELYARLAGYGLKIPIINSERNHNYKIKPLQRIADALTCWLITAVVANSNSGRRFAVKRLPLLEKCRFHVVWNGIEVESVEKRVASCTSDYKLEFFGNNDIKLACMVAAIKPQKNYELALNVAEELISLDSRWRVVFLGNKLEISGGTYMDFILNKYKLMKHGDKIVFLGNRNDVLEILSQSDVSFLTSEYEGFPNAVLESLSVGTPTVTTYFSDIEDITPFDWSIEKSNNVLSFVEKIRHAEAVRDQISRDCKNHVIKNFSIEKSVNDLVDVYKIYSEVGAC
ncbi:MULTISPECIES: glycosyltransferase [Methylomonas]|uniref:Glycosyltransferase n=1 Tax=Methylomonas koyamae TaxID=702114 RepID=A0A177PFT1_9GAMM|nr:glycosyltransferase [Methylomonas koyamae]OAI28333.1 hypothetical protein A1355_01230 [Methylomonas koyamae]